MSAPHYIERQPAPPFRPFVRSLWYAGGPVAEPRRERMLPSGCAHIVVSLSCDFLTECVEDRLDQRTAPALMVGQRSSHEFVSTADFVELAGVLFQPGTVPAILADRADLISNRNLPLDQIWPHGLPALRSRILEGSTPEARLHILEDCLIDLLAARTTTRAWNLHPAVRFALQQLERFPATSSVAELARQSGWSERRLSQLFREQVGFSPKTWHRLQRFQHAVRALHANPEPRWAQIAVQCGFYDQAHFANEFRAFSGIDLTTYKAGLQLSSAE